ncbi:hypothetical protein EIP98_16940 [Xanthomonas campestris pv. raphani]
MGIGNGEWGMGNRESGIGNRKSVGLWRLTQLRWERPASHSRQFPIPHSPFPPEANGRWPT